MSLNSRMKPAIVEILTETISASGARKKEWQHHTDILLAVYKISETNYRQVIRFQDMTHSGLTHYKGLKAEQFRITQGDHRYSIMDVDNDHRLAQLTLKEVVTW